MQYRGASQRPRRRRLSRGRPTNSRFRRRNGFERVRNGTAAVLRSGTGAGTGRR